MLAITGPKYDITQGFYLKSTHISITNVREKKDPNITGTGGSYWDASLVFLKYLEANSQIVENKTVVEIGAGLGITSIGCKVLGCKTMISTDLFEVLSNLTKNAKNNHCELEIRELN